MTNICPFSVAICNSISEFHFIRPVWLLAFLPYFVILALMLRNKLGEGNWSNLCDPALLPFLLQQKATAQSRLPFIATALAALLSIVALAGPTWNRLPSPAFRNVSALVIMLNLNSTMDAADIKPSRLIKAKYKISDILKRRKDGQTALVVFAGDAFTVTPLTNDTNTIDSQLSALTTDIMPVQGNNTALAIQKAVELCKQAGIQKGQLLLVTDSVDMSNALGSVQTLGDFQLSILGVGTKEGAPVALPEGGFMKNSQGSIVISRLNVEELTTLAQAGHGIFQIITANDDDLHALLSQFDKPVTEQIEDKTDIVLDQWNDKGPWLLLLVIPLIALNFRKGLLCLVFLLFFPFPKNSYAVDWQGFWQTRDQQGQQAYKAGDYDKAAQLFEKKDWKAAAQYKAGHYDEAVKSLNADQSDNSFYNKGNALAQSGQFNEAIKAYKKALEKNPQDADARFNKELVEKELEKQKQKQQQQQSQQDKNQKQESKDDSAQKNQGGGQNQQSDEGKNQDKSSENESTENQQSPEQNQQSESENKSENGEQKQQEAQKQEQSAKEQAAKQEQQQAGQQGEQQKEQPAENEKPVNEQPAQMAENMEKQQANKQWLQRIPDDPAGLLKRKFKYQYGQRNKSGNDGSW